MQGAGFWQWRAAMFAPYRNNVMCADSLDDACVMSEAWYQNGTKTNYGNVQNPLSVQHFHSDNVLKSLHMLVGYMSSLSEVMLTHRSEETSELIFKVGGRFSTPIYLKPRWWNKCMMLNGHDNMTYPSAALLY